MIDGDGSLWQAAQDNADGLIAAGAANVEVALWNRWPTIAASDAAGIYMIRSADDELLYIGESDDVAERVGTHAGDSSYFSSVRRNVGRTLLGLTYGVGLRRRFVVADEDRVTAFLSACSVAAAPVTIGRGEIEVALISQSRPRLNRRR